MASGGEHYSEGGDVEVVQTRAAGWAWRCHPCDITEVGLDEAKAAGDARAHVESHAHRVVVSRRGH